jgi:hypothetical protein
VSSAHCPTRTAAERQGAFPGIDIKDYLQRACGGDAPLRARVESLIEAHEAAGSFLKNRQAGANGPTRTVLLPVTEKAGDRIGRYKLLQEIGEGGCGVVYMAEQEEPVRRRVALKVIKLGMDTRQVVGRFEAERQARAMMDHPNIAKVLDGGATDTGRPSFVMELVRGVRMTEYCDQNCLSTNERLNLFIQVCHAVQHAHQKGVIHRDIKPSNIRVRVADDVPVPKMIDFGIAKAIGEPLTDKTVYTRFDQFIGTPAYMSPEQAGCSVRHHPPFRLGNHKTCPDEAFQFIGRLYDCDRAAFGPHAWSVVCHRTDFVTRDGWRERFG